MRPDLAGANRAELTRETLEAMRAVWDRRRASYQGKYVRFTDVESYPKPVQQPLPIYSGGNVDGSMRRAAELCQGWLPAKIGPSKISEGRAKVAAYARAVGRDPGTITTALQSVVCLGDTPEQARETFLNSSFDLFRTSLAATMTKGVDLDAYLETNLVGTPDQVCEKVAALAAAGCEHLTALLFVGNTVDEMRDQIRAFARHVVLAFPDAPAGDPPSR